MDLAVISAIAANRVIGINNRMPWHLPEDLKRFKELTMGSPMLMGRKTFESLPSLLPGRRHLVLSRNPGWEKQGAEVFSSIQSVIDTCKSQDVKRIFVIGGGEIYQQALPIADILYLTNINIEAEGDTVFPLFDASLWEEASREGHVSEKGIEYAFVTYQRKA